MFFRKTCFLTRIRIFESILKQKASRILLILIVFLVAFGVYRGFLFLNAEKPRAVIPQIGEIQVLNACGIKNAAQTMSEFLRGKGFDVVESGNYDEWNFAHTIVAGRNENMKIARDIAAELNTDRVLFLRQEGTLLDATVFVGNDFKKLVKGN
jgi:hypothetical protein